MSTLLRALTLALILLITGALTATDAAAVQARGATPESAVRTMVARGGSATDVAKQLQQDYRLERDEVAQLLKEAGFDGRSIDAALRSTFGGASRMATQPRGARRSAVPRATGPSTRASQPATQTGPPTAVGPSKPSVSVSLVSISPNRRATVEVSSGDAPTAMRVANNEAELRTAPWQPYQPRVNFVTNGSFPAQVVVQVGKPVGPAAHPVNGPHVVSDPQTTWNDAYTNSNTPIVRSHLRVVSWQRASGGAPQSDFAYRDTDGVLTLALDGLGDVEEIQLSGLLPCSEGSFMGASPSVSKAGDGSYLIEVRGNVPFYPGMGSSSNCTHQVRVLGKGGNFEPGVSYRLLQRDERFRFRDLPLHTTDQTFDFAYGPKMEFSGLPTSLATSGCQVSRGSGGRLTMEMRSGPVPGTCDFRSRVVYLPRGVDVSALHWRVEKLSSANSNSFHCQVVSIPSGTTATHQVVDPSKTDYFDITGLTIPNVDRRAAGEDRDPDWIAPLSASLRCDAHVSEGLEVDRIRLVLDRIEYHAVPWMK